MHTLTQLKDTQFAIRIEGRDSAVRELFPDWHRHDRFGLVINEALGGVGASHLLQLAIWSYYAADQRRRDELNVYPEIYAFHIGGGHGSHADYDFWGPRREVILGDDPNEVLCAINERGITRLAVPDLGERPAADLDVLAVKEVAATHDLLASAFAYSPTGRTPQADVEIAGLDRRTEQNPTKVLNAFRRPARVANPGRARRPLKEVDPVFQAYQERRAAELSPSDVEQAVERRARISEQGLATETYRRISVTTALESLG
ncbi:hypothetical protein FPZ12_008455 [Amycolatopsis acidicola]|uniref:Uncharacterized protein n=1 Tax=Amycolatopsis acidicola TaxID=2596893 RepID=A0A5N0VEH7_9PSEU|nr:hypothetical protein [Amycolatopsis acidicola]KAA9164038.1 hypothetical protein FPZ12_008455 [Amycolatopsis acidicola]